MNETRNYAAIHTEYRKDHPAQFRDAAWVPARRAAEDLGLRKEAVVRRIQRSRWPIGHARLREVAGQPRPQWEVTVEAVAIEKEKRKSP